MRSLTSDMASFSLGFIINALSRNYLINSGDLRSFIISEPSSSIIPNYGGHPAGSLTMINGKCLAMSSPYFSGFASYNLFGQTIKPEISISYEVLEIMGISKKNLDAVMLGGSIGAVIGGITAACLASGPVGITIGAIGAVCGAITAIFMFLERKKEERRAHNTKLAQNIGLAHTLLVDVANQFNTSGLLAYDTDTKIKLQKLLSTFNISEEINAKCEYDRAKLRIEDFKFVYDGYAKIISGINDIKDEAGLLITNKLDGASLGLDIKSLITSSQLPADYSVQLAKFDSLVTIVSLLNLRTADSNMLTDSSGFQFVLPRIDKSFKIRPVKFPAVVKIEPAAPVLYSTGFISEVMESSFIHEEVIQANVSGISAYAKMLISGTQGIQLLTPVINETISTGEGFKCTINEGESLVVSSTSDPLRLITAVADKGQLITMSHVVRSSTPFKIEETAEIGWFPRKTHSYLTLTHEGKPELLLLKLLSNNLPKGADIPKVEIIKLFHYLLGDSITFGALWDESTCSIEIGWFPLKPQVTYAQNVGVNLNYSTEFRNSIKDIVGAASLLAADNPFLSQDHQTLDFESTYSYLQNIFSNITILPDEQILRKGVPYYRFGDLYFQNKLLAIRTGVNRWFPSNYLTISKSPELPLVFRLSNIALAFYYDSLRPNTKDSYEFYS